MKWARSEVLAGDLALMAWMESVLGTSSMSEVRLDVTSTSYGRSHSGSPASCRLAPGRQACQSVVRAVLQWRLTRLLAG